MKLFCAVDDDYEYCKFISPQQQVCDFEWKRSEGNITMQTCDLDTDNKQVRDSVECFDVCVKGVMMSFYLVCLVNRHILLLDKL